MTRSRLLYALLLSVSALPYPAAAQSSAPETDETRSTAPTGPRAAFDEIVVTAEKREGSLQDVPVAITAFTSEQRDIAGIETFGDMATLTPGLAYSAQVDHLYIRGVGRQVTNLSVPSGVTTTVDGFYIPNPNLSLLPALFVEQTQVMRGPQGTLGGRNGIAGAVMLTTRRPTDTPYAEVRAKVGNYEYTDFQAAASGPISDNLRFRVAGFKIDQRDGYYEDVGGGSEGGRVDQYHLEGSLEGSVGERTDFFVRIMTAGADNSSGGPSSRAGNSRQPYSTYLVDSSSPLSFNGAGGLNPANVFPGSLIQRGVSVTENPGVDDFYKIAGQGIGASELNDLFGVNGRIDFHMDNFDINYVGGYQQNEFFSQQDAGITGVAHNVTSFIVPVASNPTCATTGNPFTTCLAIFPRSTIEFGQSDKWWSHELTFTSTHSGPVQWVFGGYYYNEQYTNPFRIGMPDQPEVAMPCYLGAGVFGAAGCEAALFVGGAPANPSRQLLNTDYDLTTRSQAAYGQIDWDVSETVRLTAGLRYTADQAKGTEYARLVVFGGSSLAGTPYAQPDLLGAATPAIDLTDGICAANNAAGLQAGQTSLCTIGADGMAVRGLKDSSDGLTGTAGLQWTPDADSLVYARYSRGYKSFGLNAGQGLIGGGPSTVPPETIDAYEVGIKRSWGSQFYVNAAAFYQDYRDAQIALTFLTDAGAQQLLTSIPESVSAGVEIETFWAPTSALQIAATYAYNYAAVRSSCDPAATPTNCYFDTANPAGGFQDTKGNSLPDAPRHKVALNGTYTLDLSGGSSLILSGTYAWHDEQYSSIFEESWWKAPPSHRVDLRATWRDSSEKIDVVLYVKNLLDDLQYEAGPVTTLAGDPLNPSTSSLIISQRVGPPRIFGLELRYKFF